MTFKQRERPRGEPQPDIGLLAGNKVPTFLGNNRNRFQAIPSCRNSTVNQLAKQADSQKSRRKVDPNSQQRHYVEYSRRVNDLESKVLILLR